MRQPARSGSGSGSRREPSGWVLAFDRAQPVLVQPKVKGDDIHEDFLDQAEWLSLAGFVNVDVFLRYHLWSGIGGQKLV